MQWNGCILIKNYLEFFFLIIKYPYCEVDAMALRKRIFFWFLSTIGLLVSQCTYSRILVNPLHSNPKLYSSEKTKECLKDIRIISQNGSLPSAIYLNKCSLDDNDIPKLLKFMKAHSFSGEVYLNENHITSKGAILLARYPDWHAYDLSHNNIGPDGLMAFLKDNYLYFLGIGYNPIDKKTVNAFVQSTNLSRLYLQNYSLDIQTLYALAKNQNLSLLDISDSNIDDKGIEILSKNTSIESLLLNNINISTTGLKRLANFENLTWVSLNKNKINDDGAIILANQGLSRLDLSENKITEIGLTAIVNNHSIRQLDLSNNDIKDADITLNNNSMMSLILDYNKIGDKISRAIADHSKELDDLSLSNNAVGNEGLIALSTITSLQSLKVKNNLIDDKGVIAFINAEHDYFLDLDFSHNKLGDQAAVAIANKNFDINSLNLGNNNISNIGAIALANSKGTHPSSYRLDLNNNNIGDEGAIAFSQSDLAITYLNLSHNQITDLGAIALANPIDSLNIYYLDISYNKLTSRSIDMLNNSKHEYEWINTEGNPR